MQDFILPPAFFFFFPELQNLVLVRLPALAERSRYGDCWLWGLRRRGEITSYCSPWSAGRGEKFGKEQTYGMGQYLA